MTLLSGTAIAGSLGALMIMAGYVVAGFMTAEGRLTRLAVANLVGLAWLIFGASVVGAMVPLSGPGVWLLWIPVLVTWLIPAPRKQLQADIQSLAKSPHFYAAAGGMALLWLALLLPCLVYPDLIFFDGKTNHDNFFWCVAAEYLQANHYLTVPVVSRDYPLFNVVNSITGWKPTWGRMGTEGWLAVLSSTVRRSPVEIFNFVACSLVLPWLLTVLAIARRMGLRSLNRWLLMLVCFCQPVLFFFIANGNLPNLLGAIFGGGLWLLALLLYEESGRGWPRLAAGALLTHGLLCCYPEILPFALVPVALLVVWRIFQHTPGRARFALLVSIMVIGGLCLNPLTTARAWNGFWNSIDQVRRDTNWANIFAPLTCAGYVPSLITLAMPSMRLYGVVGGIVASLGVLTSFVLLVRRSSRRGLLFVSLSGFLAMLAYTIVNSFGYGWQKSVQFFGVHLAVLFPVLFTDLVQERFRLSSARRLPHLALLATLGVMVHGMVGSTWDNLKWAGSKGVTRQLLALRDRVAQEFPGQPISVDGATFRASFFHSMWSARLFARNPLVILSRQEQPGGYLRDSIALANPTTQADTGLYYVAANWAKAFDYETTPLVADRVGVLLKQHNLITELSGFYRTSGVPQMCNAEFSLTVYPYADGWLEFTLAPNGKAGPDCRLQGSAVTDLGVENQTILLNAQHRLVVRFPLKAGTRNLLTARLDGAPPVDLDGDDPPYPFLVLDVQSARLPAGTVIGRTP